MEVLGWARREGSRPSWSLRSAERSERGTSLGTVALVVVLYGLLHFAVAFAGPLFAVEAGGFPLLFFTGGLLLGVLTQAEPRLWVAYVFVAVLAEFAAAWVPPLRQLDGPFANAFLVASPVHALAALLGAFLVRSVVSQPLRLARVPAVLGLTLLGCVFATGACALIGAALLRWTAPDVRIGEVWGLWWLADAAGALLVAPLLVAAGERRRESPRLATARRPGQPLELLLAVACALGITLLAIAAPGPPLRIALGFPYLLLPIFAWIALRFRGLAVAVPVASCALALVIATALGQGPFADAPSATGGAVMLGAATLQVFLAVTITSTLLLAAAAAERDRAARAEQQAETRLETVLRLEETNRHVAGIAHDFSNVNMALSGNLDLLRIKGVPPESERFLDSLGNAVESAQVLVDRLMNSPGSSERLRDCDLPQLTREVVDRIRGSLEPGVELTLALPAEPIQRFLDPLAFDRILSNLIRNAAEAVGDAGHIDVVVASAEGQVLLTVRDDGRGMDEATRNRIFDPFFTTKGQRGKGIGLWSVRQLVEEGGGHVSVRSRLNEGATFTIRWPLGD